MFEKILIANRSEVALRVHRACREMGIKTVAVHSTADSDAMHVRLADESVCIGPPPPQDSYLNMPAILTAASLTGADAIHPGTGFLSENATFAEIVEEHGFAFIGPAPEHIRKMGNKIEAKRIAAEIGLPVVPGTDGALGEEDDIHAAASEIGYPVLVKAVAGGGGRGMAVAHSEVEIEDAVGLCRREAKAGFGNDAVYMERYLDTPRHIEIQVLGDGLGKVIHFGERDCSLQRRHQKVFEEAHSPALLPDQRAELGAQVAEALGRLCYRGAGTVEFLYENSAFFFIEMNTRLQVEHPVTEMIYGVDLVGAQIRVASGDTVLPEQESLTARGHAIECRINAEHPVTMLPSPGRVSEYHPPGGIGVRVDSALYSGCSVPPYYDSLVAKLVVCGADREECLHRLARSLDECVIGGIETNISLHRSLVEEPDIRRGVYDIHWLEKWLADSAAAEAA